MATGWQSYSLYDIITLDRRPVKLEPEKEYAEIGIYSFGRGIFHKTPRTGFEVGDKDLYLIKQGDFILQITFAWEGAVGLASENEDGMFGSVRFPTFRVNEDICYPPFLIYYFRTNEGRNQLIKISPGSAGRNRVLSLKRITEVNVPLPPLDEQRRMVARIEALAGRISEAQRMRREAGEEVQAFIPSGLFEIFEKGSQHWSQMPMTDAIAINDRQVDPRLPEYSRLPHISGENIKSKTCKLLPYRTAEEDGIQSSNYLFSPNTILYSKIRPYLRKAVIVDFLGVCSADIYPIKVINPLLKARFVMWSLVADPFTRYANAISGRTRMPKLNRKQLFAYTLKYPSISEQERIVGYLKELQAEGDKLRRLQTESQRELEALLPAVLDRAFRGEY